jgi:hypothetical protein
MSDRDDVDSTFPEVVDDAYPERERIDDPQVAALPADHYLAADEFGTTVQEEIEGESLDARLAREQPEPDPYAEPSVSSDEDYDRENRLLSDPEGATVGRLVEPDEGAHTDIEKDVVARESLDGEYDVSPEESAMHLEPEV